MMKFWCIAIVVFAALTPYAEALQYDWPNFQQGLKPAESRSPIDAPALPSGTATVVPGTSDSNAQFSGIWEGWMCRDWAVDAKMLITEVNDRGAVVTYSVGGEQIGQHKETVTAFFDRKILTGKLSSGSAITFEIRDDGHLNIKWESGSSGSWCTGILERD